MFFVGKPSIQAQRLSQVAFESMWLGIEELGPGKHLGDIGAAVQKHVEKNRFSVVREYCGHGIGEVFMKTRRFCTTASAAPAWSCAKA